MRVVAVVSAVAAWSVLTIVPVRAQESPCPTDEPRCAPPSSTSTSSTIAPSPPPPVPPRTPPRPPPSRPRRPVSGRFGGAPAGRTTEDTLVPPAVGPFGDPEEIDSDGDGVADADDAAPRDPARVRASDTGDEIDWLPVIAGLALGSGTIAAVVMLLQRRRRSH